MDPRRLIVMTGILAACPKAGESGDTGDPLVWTSLTPAGDAAGDCGPEDLGCTADISDLRWARGDDRLYLDLRMDGGFPPEATFEFFFFPSDPAIRPHTFRRGIDLYLVWEVDCDVTGCHWIQQDLPPSFQEAGPEGDSYIFSFELVDWGFETLGPAGLGAAAAWKHIEQRTQYTDWYPDGADVNQDGAVGLVEVDLGVDGR